MPTASTRVAADTVAVIGLGYVGLPLAGLAAQKGFRVVGLDTDEGKVSALHRAADALSASTDPRTLAGADVLIVAVPTPVDAQDCPDLGPLRAAIAAVARHARRGALLSIESTVNPGVCEEVVAPLLRESGRDPARGDPNLVHCPERVNPGDPRWTTRNIPRVLGGYVPEATARGLAFYRRLLDAPVRPMSSIRAAEAVKIVENAFRDVNIAFVNELAMSFDRLGLDVEEILAGAATKPFAFLPHRPGCGVGGHCIPVDPYYLISHARAKGFDHRFLRVARELNRGMPAYTVARLKEALRPDTGHQLPDAGLGGVRVALLGVAYKRDVADTRESPALEIRRLLVAEGADVVVFDPFVPAQSTAASLPEALRDAAAIVVATDHTAFRGLTPQDLRGTPVRVIVDGRNRLDLKSFRAAGYVALGIGR